MDWWRFGRSRQAAAARWVIVDVETTGLDAGRDRLLSIAALALKPRGARAELLLGDSFEVVLRDDDAMVPADRSNILLHGIGIGARRQGMAPRQALDAFAAWVASAPILGFHVAFDRAVIERHAALQGAALPSRHWVDIEPLAAVLRPQTRARALDEWLVALGIPCAARHQAAADVLATAELLLRLWPGLARESPAAAGGDIAAAARLAAQRRWLPGSAG
jgi:DNA polymerase-3 subunit epsilon